MVPSVVLRMISYVFLTLPVNFRNKNPYLIRKHMSWAVRTAGNWSDVYSRRNDLWKVDFSRVCKKLAWVLTVIWSGFLALRMHFRRRFPTIFRKHMPWGIGTESLWMIGCIFVENGPLESCIESSLNGTVCGAKGDFIRFSYLYPYMSRTHTFLESTCSEL